MAGSLKDPRVGTVGFCSESCCLMLLVYQKKKLKVFSSNGGVFTVCGFCHFALGLVTLLRSPSNACVWSVDTHCVHSQTRIPFRLHHARQSCYVFTALWYGCFVVTLTFYLHQTQFWLWLVWANSPVFTHQGMNKLTSQHNGTNKARTPPYPYPQYCVHTSQVC